MTTFATRGWLFASRDMNVLRQEIDLAPEHGINHIQLSHGIVHYAEQVYESPERRADIAELIERAHRLDIAVFIWTHEMQNLPREYFRGGKVDLSSRATWDHIAGKYDRLFAELPELDGVVLTITETEVRVDDENEVLANRPPAQRLARMISMIAEVCRRHGAKLIVRSFTWVPRTMLWYAEAMRSVPDDVIVMTKESWGDWYQYTPPDQTLGLFGRHPQMIEVDCWGEYAGGTEIPWTSAEHIRSRLRYAAGIGVSGAIARVDRHDRSTFGTINELNTIAYSRLARDTDADLGEIFTAWAERKWPADAIGPIRRALARTNEIVQLVYYTQGVKFVSQPTPTLVEAEEESEIRFWRDFHGQWVPEMTVRAARLLDPTEETLVALVAEKDRAISYCDMSLGDLEDAKPHLAAAAYESLRAGFEKMRLLACAWRALVEVTYLHKLLERAPTPRLRDWFAEAGGRLLAMADEIERTHGKGFALARPESLRTVWETASSIHGARTRWSVPLGLYIAGSPAVADIGSDGLPVIVALSSHREIAAIRGDGHRMWTVTTRGERSEYPHFSSPAIVTGSGDGARILAGAADGRLYCLDAAGRILWEYATGNRIDSAPAVGDIDADGADEVLAASLDGTLTCLTLDGARRWSLDLGDPIFAAPAITPFNEIIVATLGGTIACVNPAGSPRWQRKVAASEIARRFSHSGVPDGRIYALAGGSANAIYSSPLVADLDGDGDLDIVVGTIAGRVLLLDRNGAVVWEAACGGPVYSSPGVLARGTPGALVVVGSDDCHVHAIDAKGRTVWQFETRGPVRSSPVVVSKQVAGTECVVVGSYDRRIYVIDGEGHELEEYILGGAIFSTPIVADIDVDGFAEIVAGAYDHRLTALRTDWRVPVGHVVVGAFRGGLRRRGA